MSQKESIEDFILGDQLGHGQFATVRLARHKHTGDVYAIKIIDLGKMTDKLLNESMVQQRVLNEVNIHRDRGLRHASIVRCYNAFADGKNVYLVLEWCNMGTLKSYVENKKRLTEKEARSILSQIVDGLLVLHRNKIMHRDISMGNVLLSRDRQNNLQAKIADFGLAERLENPDMKHFTMCGTPNYMSPEVANGTGHGLQTDIFSLGSVLYTMLVGGPPFESPDLLETINKIKAVLYKMPNLLSSKAQHLIMSVMRLNPDDRLTLNEIRDHPFLTGGSLQEFRMKYPGRNLCAEWSMDSGCGTSTTASTSTVASLASHLSNFMPDSQANSLSCGSQSSNGDNMSRPGPGAGPTQSVKRSGPSSAGSYPMTPASRQTNTPRPDARLNEQNYNNQVMSSNDCYYMPAENRSERIDTQPPKPVSSQSANSNQNNRAALFTGHRGVMGQDRLNPSDMSQKCADARRLTPVLPRRMDRNHHLVEFTPHGDAGSGSPSSMSGSSCIQTPPAMSDASKDSSYSDEMRQLLPGGQLMAPNGALDLSLENETCSIASGQGGCGQLARYASETNLQAAAVAVQPPSRPKQRRQHVGSQQSLAGTPTPLTAEYAQQLRRRSRSAENLSRRQRQADGGTWSAVDIDIGAPSESTMTDGTVHHGGQTSTSNQKAPDTLPPPFSVMRLRPFRQQMNSVVYTILDDGCVCMEFFRTVNGMSNVIEVMRISSDGLQIQIYKPNNGKGCPLGPQPPPVPTLGSVHLKHFTHDALPKKHWRKYSYAALFVSNIRAKTPKVTLYTRRAKFQVMENTDVEVTFYDGAKYHRADDAVRIILRDGTIKPLETSTSVTELSEEGQEMCQYVTEILQICSDMTNLLSSLQAHCGRGPDVSLFPIVVGRRPPALTASSADGITSDVGRCQTASGPHPSIPHSVSSQNSLAVSQTDKFEINSISQQTESSSGIQKDVPNRRLPATGILSGHLSSTRSATAGRTLPGQSVPPAAQTQPPNTRTVRPYQGQVTSDSAVQKSLQGRSGDQGNPVMNLRAGQQNDKRALCSVDVPGIGRASKYANGVVWLHYNDGSQLGVKVTPPSYIVSVTCDGQMVKYHADDEIPDFVQFRVGKDLQVAMGQLNMLREV